MPELTEKLDAAARVAEELRAAETTVDEIRARFRVALREAHEAGGSYGLLGRVVGLSRQRVARIIAGS